ncbi:hypothetical protein KY330_02865 [Candidatus Woesearchaeota archaeon]|nr:hypothetical protein [Candidatus Woesearchaeota archaeon]
MGIVGEAKALVKVAKVLQAYSNELHDVASELQIHNRNFQSAKEDNEKQKHLKKHYVTFAAVKKLKEKYSAAMREFEFRMSRVKRELDKLQV